MPFPLPLPGLPARMSSVLRTLTRANDLEAAGGRGGRPLRSGAEAGCGLWPERSEGGAGGREERSAAAAAAVVVSANEVSTTETPPALPLPLAVVAAVAIAAPRSARVSSKRAPLLLRGGAGASRSPGRANGVTSGSEEGLRPPLPSSKRSIDGIAVERAIILGCCCCWKVPAAAAAPAMAAASAPYSDVVEHLEGCWKEEREKGSGEKGNGDETIFRREELLKGRSWRRSLSHFVFSLFFFLPSLEPSPSAAAAAGDRRSLASPTSRERPRGGRRLFFVECVWERRIGEWHALRTQSLAAPLLFVMASPALSLLVSPPQREPAHQTWREPFLSGPEKWG